LCLGPTFSLLPAVAPAKALKPALPHHLAWVRALGGLYLLYMGITMLLSKTKSPTQNLVAAPKASLKRVFYQGFLTNTLNPKVALFFIAFVPQFIAPDSSNIIISFLVLGFIFSFNGLIWCLIVAWFSASAGAIIKHNQYLSITAKKLAGGLFTYFGLRLWFGSS
jgi:threonine/homoserine/homoserine lactone efflux protein